MSNLPYIYIHADDYGMTPLSSRRIEDCFYDGCLNSLSIMPNGCNGLAFDSCKKMNIPTMVHLNLVEGRALSDPERVPLLVREDGFFRYSFFGLLILSLSWKHREMKKQVAEELRLQIQRVQEEMPGACSIMLDSHQHIHMIPLIFHELMKIIEEDNLDVGYLRIPAEPILPFLMTPSLYTSYRPINMLKSIVLNICNLFVKREFWKANIPSALFCGIMFSGHMDAERVMKVFPYFYRMAVKWQTDLEFLFHPGYILQEEDFMDFRKHCFNEFYLSEGRKAEYQALQNEEFCNLVYRKNEQYYNQQEKYKRTFELSEK